MRLGEAFVRRAAARACLVLAATLAWLGAARAQRDLCGGVVAVDSASPSAAALGEMALVLRNRAPWPIRFRPSPSFPPPEPEAPPPPSLGGGFPPPGGLPDSLPGGRGGPLPPGQPFEVPPELLDRALTERLAPGGGGPAEAAPPNLAPFPAEPRPPPPTAPWRWLQPGEATTVWVVATTPREAVERLGLRCDPGAGVAMPPWPLAPETAPR